MFDKNQVWQTKVRGVNFRTIEVEVQRREAENNVLAAQQRFLERNGKCPLLVRLSFLV